MFNLIFFAGFTCRFLCSGLFFVESLTCEACSSLNLFCGTYFTRSAGELIAGIRTPAPIFLEVSNSSISSPVSSLRRCLLLLMRHGLDCNVVDGKGHWIDSAEILRAKLPVYGSCPRIGLKNHSIVLC